MLLHHGHAFAENLGLLIFFDDLRGYIFFLHLIERFHELLFVIWSVGSLLHRAFQEIVRQCNGLIIIFFDALISVLWA